MDLLEIALWALAGLAILLTALCAALFWPNGSRSPFAKDSRRPRQPIEHGDEARRTVLKVGFTTDRIPKDLDVAIVGSGIGGLLAGALLTKAGKRVCVFEQHDQAGGCLHTFVEDGFEFDTGIHYIGEMRSKSAFRVLVDQATEGQVAWAPLDAVYDTVRQALRFPRMRQSHLRSPLPGRHRRSRSPRRKARRHRRRTRPVCRRPPRGLPWGGAGDRHLHAVAR